MDLGPDGSTRKAGLQDSLPPTGERRIAAPEPRPASGGRERSLLVSRHLPVEPDRAGGPEGPPEPSPPVEPQTITDRDERRRSVEQGMMQAIAEEVLGSTGAVGSAVGWDAQTAEATHTAGGPAQPPPARPIDRTPQVAHRPPSRSLDAAPRVETGQRQAAEANRPGGRIQPGGAPVVPPQSVAGRALMLVVGIMCFLACLAVGALVLVEEAARDWQLDVAREITIQVKPVDGQPMEPMLKTAMDLARATAGVRSVTLMTERESSSLLEPWLGAGFDLTRLPVPRLILIELSDPAKADLRGLSERLGAAVKNAILDDHSIWAKRLRTMAGTMVAAGGIVLILVLVAMVLSVVFATRAAMAGNRDVVEVLHFVGAEDSFIAGEFQQHFLILGFKGGIGGGVAAMLAFALAGWVTRETPGLTGSDQAHALFGSFSVGLDGYVGAVGIVLLVAGLTALTSRLTVRSYLNQLD